MSATKKGMASEPAGRASELAGRGLEPAGRDSYRARKGLEPAGRASEPAGMALKPDGSGLEARLDITQGNTLLVLYCLPGKRPLWDFPIVAAPPDIIAIHWD